MFYCLNVHTWYGTHNTVSAQHSLPTFSEKMNMTEETMNDALDDILAESGDEEEEESIVNQVLDEIGIEISGKVRVRVTGQVGKCASWPAILAMERSQ